MYKYSLQKYLLDIYKKQKYLRYEYVKAQMPRASYAEHIALSTFADVVYYSKVPLREVPARNGVLLPVRFFVEEII